MKWGIGSVVALAAMIVLGGSPVAAQSSGVNNFTISSYDIEYELSRDEAQRSVLRTTEVITAEFPHVDQNHGIERVLPATYDGHSVGLDIVSVTDANGKKQQYATSARNQNTVVRIGDPDRYAHGTNTYKIVYEQRDVTRFFTNTNKDEWYWDTNGTQWRVPIERLSVRATVADELKGRLTGDIACYEGATGSNSRCTAMRTDGFVTEVVARNMQPGENITLAIGFLPETFAAYEPSFIEKYMGYIMIAWVVGGVGGLVIGVWRMVRWGLRVSRTREVGTVVLSIFHRVALA